MSPPTRTDFLLFEIDRNENNVWIMYGSVRNLKCKTHYNLFTKFHPLMGVTNLGGKKENVYAGHFRFITQRISTHFYDICFDLMSWNCTLFFLFASKAPSQILSCWPQPHQFLFDCCTNCAN